MSHEGRGIAHVNGKTVFVFGALLGEKVLIQVQQSKRNFDQATTLEVLEASPRRIEPRCEAFKNCGGCSLQHLPGDDQLALKQQSLLDIMEHARIDIGQLIPALRADSWGYRKKARLGVKYVPAKGRVLVGFRERNTPFIADMLRCEVLIPRVGHRLQELSQLIGQLEARAQIPQIEVAADESQVQLVFRHLQPLCERDLGLLSEFARRHDFLVQLQPGGPATVHNLYPEQQSLGFDPLGDGSLRIGFGALDFVQVNSGLNRKMVWSPRRSTSSTCRRRTGCWTCFAVSAILPCRWRENARELPASRSIRRWLSVRASRLWPTASTIPSIMPSI
jgi:23S rRNA (uracil1939-C5)-methyltransferase